MPAIIVLLSVGAAVVTGMNKVDEIEARQHKVEVRIEKVAGKLESALDELRKERREDRDLLIRIKTIAEEL